MYCIIDERIRVNVLKIFLVRQFNHKCKPGGGDWALGAGGEIHKRCWRYHIEFIWTNSQGETSKSHFIIIETIIRPKSASNIGKVGSGEEG